MPLLQQAATVEIEVSLPQEWHIEADGSPLLLLMHDIQGREDTRCVWTWLWSHTNISSASRCHALTYICVCVYIYIYMWIYRSGKLRGKHIPQQKKHVPQPKKLIPQPKKTYSSAKNNRHVWLLRESKPYSTHAGGWRPCWNNQLFFRVGRAKEKDGTHTHTSNPAPFPPRSLSLYFGFSHKVWTHRLSLSLFLSLSMYTIHFLRKRCNAVLKARKKDFNLQFNWIQGIQLAMRARVHLCAYVCACVCVRREEKRSYDVHGNLHPHIP